MTVIGWPRMMDPELAREYVGGQSIFDDLLAQKLVKPRVQKKGCTRYDRVELDHALDEWRGFN